MPRLVDSYGRVSLEMDDLLEVLYSGAAIGSAFVEPSEALNKFNVLCDMRAKEKYKIVSLAALQHSPEEEHARRQNTWLVAEEMTGIDVRKYTLGLCETQEQRDRINLEMDMFEARAMVPVLRLMIYLVEHFRAHGVVWGVGRGSSVASLVLYKIGLHRIDPLRFKLDINEFLK